VSVKRLFFKIKNQRNLLIDSRKTTFDIIKNLDNEKTTYAPSFEEGAIKAISFESGK